MLALVTTARKAGVAALVAFLSPPTALLVSDQPLSFRVFIASVLLGVIAGLTTYEAPNTEEYGPVGKHHPAE